MGYFKILCLTSSTNSPLHTPKSVVDKFRKAVRGLPQSFLKLRGRRHRNMAAEEKGLQFVKYYIQESLVESFFVDFIYAGISKLMDINKNS